MHPALIDEAAAAIDVAVEHAWVDVGEVTLHVALAGPRDGASVILLHGFPEAWFGWRHQIKALAGAGFRVIVPDQRGYNLSEKPEGIDAYRMDHLVGDIVGLARVLGLSTWHLAGHDWGGAVAWAVAHERPHGLERLAVVNLPEPTVFLRHARRPRQALRSWYMAAFQLPLAEWWLARNECRALERALTTTSVPGTFDGVLGDYRRAWSRPGAVEGMLGWYRAALQRPLPAPPAAKVVPPTLLLWGEGDRFLGAEMLDPSAERCEDAKVIRYPDATHWVLHEEPAATSAALVEHFRAET